MDQATLRLYAADGIRRQIALLQQQLAQLERPATKRAAPAKKSMWTPARRAALSRKMKQLAEERKKGK